MHNGIIDERNEKRHTSVDVVAAIIWKENRFLACQRSADKSRGLLWEFVGGKLEKGETREQALIRECREELDIGLKVGSVFAEVNYRYPDITVNLTFFNAEIIEGEPKLLEHNALAWVAVDELENYEFCPADMQILNMIKESKKRG